MYKGALCAPRLLQRKWYAGRTLPSAKEQSTLKCVDAITRYRIQHFLIFSHRLSHLQRQLRIFHSQLFNHCRQVTQHMAALPEKHRHHAHISTSLLCELFHQFRQARCHQFEKSQRYRYIGYLRLHNLLQPSKRLGPAWIAGTMGKQDKGTCHDQCLSTHNRAPIAIRRKVALGNAAVANAGQVFNRPMCENRLLSS